MVPDRAPTSERRAAAVAIACEVFTGRGVRGKRAIGPGASCRQAQEGSAMRFVDARYECAHCGAILAIPLVETPTVVIHAASGRPNERVLIYDGREIHRCEVPSRSRPRAFSARAPKD